MTPMAAELSETCETALGGKKAPSSKCHMLSSMSPLRFAPQGLHMLKHTLLFNMKRL